jgi:TPR repeat protein
MCAYPKYCPALWFALLLLLTAAAPAIAAPARPVPPAPAGEEQGRRFALLVGVNEYRHSTLPNLRYAENDVSELAAVLKRAHFEVVLLTGGAGRNDPGRRPTLANIERQLQVLLERCDKKDTVLVALAGHGLQFNNVADNYFCPQDARPFADEESRKTLLSLTEVFRQLEQNGAGVKLLLVDACRNDPSPLKGRGLDGTNTPRPPRGTAALFSCSPGEKAFENDGYRHGVFFYHVLEGLRGRAKDGEGDVTWDSLQNYVRKQVAADVPRIFHGEAQQTPSLNAGELAGIPPVLIDHSSGVAGESTARLGVYLWPLHQATASGVTLPLRSQPQLGYVLPGGCGDRLGLKRGDVLVRINGRPVATVPEATAAYKDVPLGSNIEIVVHRAGKELTVRGPYATPFGDKEEIRRVREDAVRDAAAQGYLAWCSGVGRGTPRNPQEAVEWYRKAAEQGLGVAQFELALRYDNGHGVTKDESEAVRWFRQAASQGFPGAQYQLGLKFDQGRGVAQDAVEAARFYRKAADQEVPAAQCNLGWMYAHGRGVQRSDEEAVKWYRKAADRGVARAQYRLGFMYANGRGVAKDEAEAARWYRKAAERGDAEGLFALGYVLETGRGAPADRTEALKWYQKAAAKGSPEAKTRLKQLGVS